MEEVENLEQQLKADNNCFRGWCRYRLCKQISKKTETMIQLNKSSEFKQFSVSATLPDIEYFSSGNFVYFHSTKLASDQLLQALQDDSTYIIGLYGMGGSGKTTLVKEVGKKAKELKFFGRVVFATVSQTPDIRRIQGEIADLLGLQLHEETEPGRARRLSVRLNSGEKILIILDDVWGKLKLKDIGIPFEDYHFGCKVLLTTRRQQVCCVMDCQRKIPLYLLSEEEAWTLFQKHAGIDDGYFNLLNGVAQDVARECKGLPIAIEAVGTSLKGKSGEEWKVALRRLRYSKPIDVEAGVRDVFTCLQLSYDYLRSKEAKFVFLMCCMFPEDHEIFIDDLFRIAVGLGICWEVHSLESARNQVNAGINNLIDSCLLMKSEKRKDHLKMHDMVRDVALWIASKENCTIMINVTKGFNELVDEEAVKNCYALTSWCNEVDDIPRQLDAPMLEILLLKTRRSLELSNVSFESMKALKVMAMIAENYYHRRTHISLPHSMQLLTNLQTLRLEGWYLGDLSWVVSLKRLQILDLKGSSFKELPNGLKDLNNLKQLDLSWCGIGEQCYEVIESCPQLEELYAFRDGLNNWTISGNVTFPKLHRYVLQIGSFPSNISWVPTDLSTRTLHLGQFNISAASSFINDLLKRAEDICFHCLYEGCKTIVPDMVHAVGGMNELTNLWLDSCLYLECVIDTSSHHADLFQAEALLPNLIKLKLKSVYDLKEVCRGPPVLRYFEKLQELEIEWCTRLWSICPGQWAFCNLKILTIDCCPELTSLFPMSVARTMLVLQELTIKGCSALKHIIKTEGEDGTGSGTVVEIFPSPENSCLMFPQLKMLSITSCPELKHIFPISYVQGLVSLEQVCITAASKLKYVFGPIEIESNEIVIELPRLKLIRLQGLANLLSIFPKKYHSRCPSLRELYWVNCPKFSTLCPNIMVGSDLRHLCDPNLGNWLCSEIQTLHAFLNLEKLEIKNCSVQDILFQFEGVVITNTDLQKQLISCLNFLKLKNLPELKFIWTGPAQTLSLQNLKEFTVGGCNGLKSIFSESILRSLAQLEKLSIKFCNDLEEIISCSEVQELHQNSLNAHPRQVCFPNLKELKVMGCNKLKCLFSVALARDDLPELRYLCVSGVAQLHHVFGGETELDWQDNDLEHIILPNLRQLTLKEVPNLIDFCQSFKLHNICFQHVPATAAARVDSLHHRTEVVVTNGNDQLIYEVPALLAAAISVKELDIQNCGAVNLFHLHEVDLAGELMTSKLVRLGLENLPELRFIWTGPNRSQILSLQYLQLLEVNQCRKLKSVFSVVVCGMLPELTHLMISDCEELEDIIAVNEEPQNHSSNQVGFPKLRELKVERCNNLKTLFSAAIARMLPKLNLIFISEAAQLMEVFSHKDEDIAIIGAEIVLPNLREIKLENLPSLIDVCQRFKLHAAQLCKVLINGCPKFAPVFRATQINPLHRRTEELGMVGANGRQLNTEILAPLPAVLNVKDLHIQNSKAVNIFQLQGAGLVDNRQGHINLKSKRLKLENLSEMRFIWTGPAQVLSLLNLQDLVVYQCEKLKSVFSVVIHRSLPELTSLTISDCDELEEIITENKESQNLSNAQIYFPKLERLTVERCNKLKSLFSAAMARMLPQLEWLHVSEAANLEEVFGNEREVSTGNEKEIVLPNLRSIYLNKLPSFFDVCKGFKLNAVKLGGININECPKFSSIMGANKEILIQQKAEEEPLLMNGSQLFDEVPCLSRTILNVRFLDFKNCGVVKLFNLQGVDLGGDRQEFVASNLIKLKLENLPELKFIWMGSTATRIWSFQYLEELTVNQCGKLKYIFSAVISLPELKYLTISECEELEEIIAEIEEPHDLSNMQICFPELTILRIKQCNKLKTLFCTSTLGMLPKLRQMCISEAAQLEYVFVHKSKEGTVNPEEIVLPDLTVMELFNLPSLIDFCKGIKLHAKGLWTVKINECPNVLSISLQHKTEGHFPLAMDGSLPCNRVPLPTLLPAATTLKLGFLNLKNCGVVNLFDFQGVGVAGDQQDLMASNLSELKLGNLPELRFICTGTITIPVLSFRSLGHLQVNHCGKLKSIFSTVVHRSLPVLQSLIISDCDELEEIIAEIEEPKYLSDTQVCFPELKEIKVMSCNKLRSLLPVTVAKILPQLSSLCISEAAQLEELFRHNSEEGEGGVNREGIVLPKLKTIELTKLPCLVDVCRGFELHAERLREVLINDCPNLPSILTATQEMPLQPKAETSNGPGSSGVPVLQAAVDKILQAGQNKDDEEDEDKTNSEDDSYENDRNNDNGHA